MTKEEETKTQTETPDVKEEKKVEKPATSSTPDTGDDKPKRKKFDPSARRNKRTFEKPEFDQKTINIRRVTRVMAGGRRFAFSASVVIGDKKGRVGVGTGKSSDTAMAIQKAVRIAKKDMIKLQLNEEHSIDREVTAKFASSEVIIRPNHGRGLVAGSSVRNVLDLAGIKGVSAKVISRSKNKLNNAKAALKALSAFKEK